MSSCRATNAKAFREGADLLALSSNGPWLVGGAVRRLINRDKQDSDFDVAFATLEQKNALLANLKSQGFSVFAESAMNTELRKDKLRIQLLTIAYYETLETALDSFDFTICQFGYDGDNIVCGEYALFDLGRKRLALHRLSYGASTIRRLLKYTQQGYTACQGTFVSILEAVAKDPSKIQAEVHYVD